MRAQLAILLVLSGGCAAGPHTTERSGEALAAADVIIRALPSSATEGTDARPRVEVTVGRVTREGSAAVRFAGGAAYVDAEHRLHAIDAAGRERLLGEEVLAAPVADASGSRLAWAEAHDLGAPELRTLGAWHASAVTIARAPGAMAPLAFLDDGTLALVGSVNGGVAGLWLAEARGGGSLECLTNCELRAGTPWGDAYVPPPEGGASIHADGDRVTFVAADGSQRTVSRSDVRRGGAR